MLNRDGHPPHPLQDLRTFREHFGLPLQFGVALFEPKDFDGLASIDSAGNELNAVRQSILNSIPAQTSMQELPALLDQLSRLFESQLYSINAHVQLKDVEIEYAVAGYADMLRALQFALLRARAARAETPTFHVVYQQWLDNSLRLSQRVHLYEHQGEQWRVQVLNNAYGRMGLRVETGEAVYELLDGVYACPAQGYMFQLMRETVTRLLAALGS